MDYREGENHIINRPEQYSYWRDYIPELNPPWPGRMLSWTYTQPISPETFHLGI